MKTYTDDMIITALLTHGTRREAAESLGMNERYMYIRMKDKPFQEKLAAASNNLINAVYDQLRKNLTSAITVLSDIMMDAATGAQTRVNAANSIIANYMKISERIEITDRLDRLEAYVNERNGH